MGSFLLNYRLFSKIIIVSIFFDFVVRRLFMTTYMPAAISILSTVNYIILTIILVCLFVYRIYEFILSTEKLFIKIAIAISGIGLCVFMTVLLYLRNFDTLYYALFFTFYIILFILYSSLLYLLILKRKKNELGRTKEEYKLAISIFISVFIFSFLFNTIINTPLIITIFPNIVGFSFYLNNISIYSMLVIMIYFSFYALRDFISLKKLYHHIINAMLLIIIFLLATVLYRLNLTSVIFEIFRALSIPIITLEFIYVLIAVAFIISTVSLLLSRGKNKIYFIALLLFIISGISSYDLYLRLLSVFSIIEIITINNKNPYHYDLNNTSLNSTI